MRKKSFLVALSVVFGLLMNPILVHADVYKWTDDRGDVHFTDDYSNIPEKYRPVAETQRFPQDPKETSPSSVEKKPTPALAPKVSEPPVQKRPAVQKIPLVLHEDLCRETGIYILGQRNLDSYYTRNGGDCYIWRHRRFLIIKPEDTVIIYRDPGCKTEHFSKNPTYDVYKSFDANQDCRVMILLDGTLSDL